MDLYKIASTISHELTKAGIDPRGVEVTFKFKREHDKWRVANQFRTIEPYSVVDTKPNAVYRVDPMPSSIMYYGMKYRFTHAGQFKKKPKRQKPIIYNHYFLGADKEVNA